MWRDFDANLLMFLDVGEAGRVELVQICEYTGEDQVSVSFVGMVLGVRL